MNEFVFIVKTLLITSDTVIIKKNNHFRYHF